MSKKKRNIIIITFAVVVIFILVLVLFVLPIKDYNAKTPKLHMKQIGDVQVGETLTVQDFVEVECKGDYHVDIAIKTEISDAKVSEDGQSLYVGSNSGDITVVITAVGPVHESRSEETTIHVSLGEQ